MDKDNSLIFKPGRTFHLCVDMQRMFTEETDWHLPWARKIIPRLVCLIEGHAVETIFTRFIPPENPAQSVGVWKEYYKRWESMTVEKLGREMLDIDPALSDFIPPASIFDKRFYSPWHDTTLHEILQDRKIESIIVSGGETDVCVLATVLGAVDLGYRVILAKDAVCSYSDEAHDAAIDLYHRRYSLQVFPMKVDDIVDQWR